jgi:hypothetical protein
LAAQRQEASCPGSPDEGVPSNNFSGRTLHPLDKVEQDRAGLRHRVFVQIIGGLYGRANYSIILKRADLYRVRLETVALLHQLVAAVVHQQ